MIPRPVLAIGVLALHVAALLAANQMPWVGMELIGLRIGLVLGQCTLLALWIYIAPVEILVRLAPCAVLGMVAYGTEPANTPGDPLTLVLNYTLISLIATLFPLMAAKSYGCDLAFGTACDLSSLEPRRRQSTLAQWFGAMLGASLMFFLARVGAGVPGVVWVGTILAGWLWVFTTLFVILGNDPPKNAWWYAVTLATGGFVLGTILGGALPAPAWLGIAAYTVAVLGTSLVVRVSGYQILWLPEPKPGKRTDTSADTPADT